jgi:hypothetical protein
LEQELLSPLTIAEGKVEGYAKVLARRPCFWVLYRAGKDEFAFSCFVCFDFVLAFDLPAEAFGAACAGFVRIDGCPVVGGDVGPIGLDHFAY